MNYRPALLGQVRLAQTESWGTGPGPTPLPMAPPAPPPAPAPAEQRNIPSTIYAGGAIVAVMAAIGALLA